MKLRLFKLVGGVLIFLLVSPILYYLTTSTSTASTSPVQETKNIKPRTQPQKHEYKNRNIESYYEEYLPTLSTRHPSHSLSHLPLDNLWAYITSSTLVYRIAHFDYRKSAYGGPMLIVLALYDKRIQTFRPTLYAKVVYPNGRAMCLGNNQGTFKKLRKPRVDEVVLGYIILFQLPSYERPTAAFMCTKVDCSSCSAHLTVFWEEPPANKLDFAVCLHQAIFQQSDHEEVAAWLEMNRALGAQKVTLYYQEINTKVVETIQKYVDEGFVDAFDWFNNFTTEADNNFGQSILVIDCFYRNLHKTNYLALHDLDEILMPHQSPTWHGLMKAIHNNSKASHFRFCHSFLHDASDIMAIDEIEDEKNECKANLTDIPVMFKRTERTANLNCRWTRWKNIIIPKNVKKMAVHSGDSCKGYRRFDVPPSMGLLHHYRHNDYKTEEEKVQDFTAHKHMKGVMHNLLEKFCKNN